MPEIVQPPKTPLCPLGSAFGRFGRAPMGPFRFPIDNHWRWAGEGVSVGCREASPYWADPARHLVIRGRLA
jgi:hypothetical protein